MEVRREMEKKIKVEKTPDEIRADARQRKRNQRARDYAARDELRIANMDPVEARVRKIMAQIAQQPHTTPGAPLPNPGPAWLPSLSEWHKFLQSIPHTVAIEEELRRVEAAIAPGMTEFPRQVDHG